MERRRNNRHELALPVQLPEGDAQTRDVSVDGVYIESRHSRSIGEQIEFSMVLDYAVPAPLKVLCFGTVVRDESRGALWGVAAEIESFSFLGVSGKPERNH